MRRYFLNTPSLVRFKSNWLTLSTDLPCLWSLHASCFNRLGAAPIVVPCLTWLVIRARNGLAALAFHWYVSIALISRAAISIVMLNVILSSNIAHALASTNTQLLPHILSP